MAKRSSDPRVAYPEVKVKVQMRGLVLVVGIVASFAPRGGGRGRGGAVSILGKFI